MSCPFIVIQIKYPNSKNIGHRILSIPMYPSLQDNEVEYVVEVINSYYNLDN